MPRSAALLAFLALAFSCALPSAACAGDSRTESAQKRTAAKKRAAAAKRRAAVAKRRAAARRERRRRAAAQAARPAAEPPGQLFAPTSFWNAPLSGDAPIDPMSSQYVADLRRQVAVHGTWINSRKYSTPVYTVPADQPRVFVKLDNVQADLQEALREVPIPPDARPADGTDRTLTIWQPSTDTLWELWLAEKRSDGWHARYGGRMTDVSTNEGYFPRPKAWGATASSLPAIGGTMRIHEARAGRFDHALAIALPETRMGTWSWPAQRTDGRSLSPTAIPQGARFRLDPKLNIDALGLPPFTRMMAEAVQRHGMVVRDTAGAVAFYAEDPTPTGGDPYSALYGNKYPSELLAKFPWDKLVVLRTKQSG